MNMICIAANGNCMAVELITNPTYICMQFRFHRLMDEREPILCTKYDMHIIFN